MRRLLISLTMLAAGQAALAQPWSFTKIVDSKTVIPGSAEKFDGADSLQYVSVYADRVAFRGQSKSALHFGVYEWQNGVGRAIADHSDFVPGTNDVFYGFQQVYSTADGVTFSGGNNDNGGIFFGDGTALGHVADRRDNIPDGNGKFTGIDVHHHTVGTSTVFAGRNDASALPSGVYRSDDGVLSRIADKTMSPPGRSELFSAMLSWSLDGNATLFTAETASGYRALMRSVNGQITTLVDTEQMWSDGNHFNGLGHIRISGGNTAFRSMTDDFTTRLYKLTDHGIDLLVDVSMPPPDGSSPTYGGVVDFAYANDTLVFEAGNGAMYTDFGGSMSRVIGPGDTLDGKKILNLTFYEHGFDGTTAAFWVIFEGDSSFSHDLAIYTVTIPAPGAAGLVFSCTMLALGRRRRAVFMASRRRR
ncbi:MAG: hypothetical protein IT434_05385 [Phycisphaerales bacterium]|jgi:hypothetical protein|nr:hypothetical protein [Phycisphaerales bacterium]